MARITFGLLKPDCIISQIEQEVQHDIVLSGFRILAQKRLRLNERDVQLLYRQNMGETFFKDQLAYMMVDDSIAFVAGRDDGKDAITEMNTLVGYYDPACADEGTLRKKYVISDNYTAGRAIQNVIHSSPNLKAAQREIQHFFPLKYRIYVRKGWI